MNCYRENCHHKTHHCCQECGEPVCKEHRRTVCLLSNGWVWVGPLRGVGWPHLQSYISPELVCDRCINQLQERGQDFSEVPGL